MSDDAHLERVARAAGAAIEPDRLPAWCVGCGAWRGGIHEPGCVVGSREEWRRTHPLPPGPPAPPTTDYRRDAPDYAALREFEQAADPTTVLRLLESNRRLREALEWYAAHAAWHVAGDMDFSTAEDDRGRRARAALRADDEARGS